MCCADGRCNNPPPAPTICCVELREVCRAKVAARLRLARLLAGRKKRRGCVRVCKDKVFVAHFPPMVSKTTR